MNKEICVLAEHLQGKLAEITFEMLAKGRELADATGYQLTAVLMGSGVSGLVAELGAADTVVTVEHAQLENFNPQAQRIALAEVVKARTPALLLVANSPMGMDVAAPLSIEARAPLVAYAVDIAAADGGFVVTSQLYGGKINVESQLNGATSIVSVLSGVAPAEKGRREGAPKVEPFAAPAGLDALKVRFKRLIQPEGGDVDITAQDILVSVGRGIQSEENLPVVQELAQALGGAVAASRPIVDSKWLPRTRQVGKSGLKVKPKFYLAVGISGAPEHIEGMKDAELIVAINSDPAAPIFDYAHYGVVGDLFDIIPVLTEKLKG